MLALAVARLNRDIAAGGAGRGDEVFFVEQVRKAGKWFAAIDRSWFPKNVGVRFPAADPSWGSIYVVLEKYCYIVKTGGWEPIWATIPAEPDLRSWSSVQMLQSFHLREPHIRARQRSNGEKIGFETVGLSAGAVGSEVWHHNAAND